MKSATLITLGEKMLQPSHAAERSEDLLTTKISIEKLPFTPLHDMREIKGTLEQLTGPEVLAEADTQDYMHITLTDEEEIFDVFGKLRAVYPNLMALDFDNSRTRAEGATMLVGAAVKEKTTMELFREFFKKQAGGELTPMQEKIMEDIMEEKEH